MKRTFKDFAQQDVRNVFINSSEFAESANINGIDMEVVPFEQSLKEKNTDKKLAECVLVFNVAAENFEYIPIPEKYMLYNDNEYKIEVVNNNMGMLTIGLSRNDS